MDGKILFGEPKHNHPGVYPAEGIRINGCPRCALDFAALKAATARMILNADDTREVCELMDLADKADNCRKAEADFKKIVEGK